VTDEAVIHREKKLFFSEERYEIPLRQIQNVNILISPLGQTLHYGNIEIDTAAARGRIIFTQIPKPALVQRLIQDASAEARSGRRIQYRESIRHKLEDQFNPERLKPVVPGSVLVQPEPEPSHPSRFDRFRTLRGFLPRFEIREAGRVTWRKHWFNLIVRTWLPLLAFLFASYLLLVYSLAFISEAFGFARAIYLPPVSWLGFQTWIFLLLLLLWVLALLWLIYQYAEWRNDIYILTDDEVIDVQRELAIYPLFFLYTESRRTASLANVQFVDFQIPNPLAVILNYGHVIIQTAGAEGTLDFLALYNPSRVHGEIIRRLAEYQEKQREREFEERWEDMAEWFEAYDNMRDHT
jgi:membrane protein YdbS with pleckstrin-like domain